MKIMHDPQKEYRLTMSFECPSEIKEEYIREYISGRVFTEGWGGAFGTNYINVKSFEISGLSERAPEEVITEIKEYLKSSMDAVPLMMTFGGMPHTKKYIESLASKREEGK